MFGYKELKSCRLCGDTNIETVFDLGKQYVVNFIPATDLKYWQRGEREQPIPLTIMICRKCSYVQCGQSVDPDRLYRKFWYKSGVNQGMRATLKSIVDNACQVVGKWDDMSVLDIGCNDGTLLSCYRGKVVKVGFDPAENLRNEAIINAKSEYIFADYFRDRWESTLTTLSPKGYRIITAIAMFYDLEDPRAFLTLIKKILHKDGIFIIQMNSLLSMLQFNAVDNVAHEHLGYYSLRALEFLVESCGLGILDAEMNGINGGSYKVTLCHLNKIAYISQWHGRKNIEHILKLEDEAKLTNIETYHAFGKRVSNTVLKLERYISEMQRLGKSFYLYGASTRGSTLMQLLHPDITRVFKGAAERNPDKFDHHMVGTWIPILDEKIAREKAEVFMVLPWHFGFGILEREDPTLQNGVNFLYPLPEPRVYSTRML